MNGYGTEASFTVDGAALEEADFCSGDMKTWAADWRSGMVVGAFVCTRMGRPEDFGLSTNF